MALASGTRIGPYEITAQIGVGGMGEVYRATDTNLKRPVAIKVLPDSVVADPERLARFQREAEVLASLNHPGIAHLYGIEKQEGQSALVMELVEGPTLADRIAGGPIPVDEALPIARQIAEALEMAHEQGIVHRDLKPANIKVRDDGTVKVLDFGLAKALEPAASRSVTSSLSPTITTPAMTQMGMILGTAAYMSPEQAKGRPADKRSDVWAFGAVLYEMLTGQRAFKGEDVSDTMASVLKADTDWVAFPDSVPPRVVTVVKRCLQRNRDQRMRDMGDVRLALDGAFETPVMQPGSEPAAAGSRWRQVVPLAVSSAVVALVLSGFVAWGLWPTQEAPAVSRFNYDLPEGQTLRNTGRSTIAISPDARAFVYNTAEGLYLRKIGELVAQVMPGTEPTLTSPVFSPDGAQVAYWDLMGELKRIGTTGGAPVLVAAGVTNPFGLSWGTDGTILFGQPDGIYQVAATGGTPQLVVRAMEGERVYGAQLLPDGESVLFSATTGDWDDGRVLVQSLATGERKTLIEGGNDARYVPTGHIVYALGDGLFGMVFDPGSRTVSGGAVPLVQGVLRAGSGQTGVAQYSVSADGTLIYLAGGATLGQNTLVWVDRTGLEESIAIEPSAYIYPRISPDGSRVALDDRNAANDVWIWNFALATRTRLTIGKGGGQYPVWTKDGTRIAFDTLTGDVAWKSSSNVGDVESIAVGAGGSGGERSPSPYFFSPTGNELVFRDQANPDTNDDIDMVALGSGKVTRLLGGSYRERNAELSPDGRWMAYQSDESGRFEIYVRPFPNVDDDRLQISNAGGQFPLWSRDGRELFYVERGPGTPVRLMSVPVEATKTSLLPRGRQPLLDWPYEVASEGRGYDVSPDGRRFLAIRSNTATTQPRLVVVQHWFEELRRLAP